VANRKGAILLHDNARPHIGKVTQKKFDDQRAVENAFEDFVEALDPQFFTAGIEKLADRWQKCVDAEGNYFD
jgi:hypothetical protein